MLIEIAIGDAYGAGFEYAPENLQFNDLSRYMKHPTHGLYPGQYTDDTQMSIAIAEVIVEGLPWDKLSITRKFVECFKRDPRDGYARGFQKFLEEMTDAEMFLANIKPDSDKSGGAMRAGPIGVFSTPEEVRDRASLQASITHDTIDGRAAAEAAALAVHYFLYKHGPKAELGKWLEKWVPQHAWSTPWVGKIKEKGWMDVMAAVTAITKHDSLSEILKRIVSFGGDVDTAGAITMAAASCSSEIAQDLPRHLLLCLEGGEFGENYLLALDAKLLAKVKA